MKKKALKTFALFLMFVALAMVAIPRSTVTLSAPLVASTEVSKATAVDGVAGTLTTIDVPGATATLALDINEAGMIVGRYGSSGQTHGFLFNAAGDLVTIDYPGASFTVATSINNRGDIVGFYALPSAPSQRHGFLLRDGVFSSFDPPGSALTNALGINDRGDIVGRFCTLSRCRAPGNGDFRAFLLRDGEFTILDAPTGAIETDAFKINDNGRIVGGFANSGGEEGLLVWRKDELTVLALPNGKPVSLDNAGMNERGDLVGVYCNSAVPCLIAPTGTHGFLITNGEFHTIDIPGAVATAATGINARGDIVGGYTDSSGRIHGFLLSK